MGAVVSIAAIVVGCTAVADGSVVVVVSDARAHALFRSKMQPNHTIYWRKRYFIIIGNQFSSFASILQYVVCMWCNMTCVRHTCVRDWE